LPGIAGVLDLRQGRNLEAEIGRMLSPMAHREWYKVEQFHQKPVALGRASPGIIDRYPQPVFSQDKSLCLVMYGEIYDYRDERIGTIKKAVSCEPDDHPSLVLNLIERKGIEMVKGLNGSFILALWNFNEKSLTIANDRFGLRPLYYLLNDDLFVFASEMKSILTFRQVKRQIDAQALAQFFGLSFIMEDRTWFEGIKALSPASILEFKQGSISRRSYWSLKLAEKERGFSQKDALERAHFLVKQAVSRQIKDDAPKMLSLSGGLDSRTILAAAAQLGHPIPTFTFGLPGCSDGELARRVAEVLGAENRFFPLSPEYLEKWARHGVWLTEGMNNCVNFHGVEFVPEIRKRAALVLNGFMGGELFGFLSLSNARLLFRAGSGKWIRSLFHRISGPFSEAELGRLFRGRYGSQIAGVPFESFAKSMRTSPFHSPFDRFYDFRLRMQSVKSFLYGLVLDNDLLEYRVPFCDYDLVDFASALPPRQKAMAFFHRRLITEKFPRLGSVPYQRTGLPVSSGLSRVLFRKTREYLKCRIFPSRLDQRRYTDYDNWMRNPLKGFVVSVLLSERALNRSYFNPDYVKRLVAEHLSAKRNLSLQLGALLTFELWNQLFIDEIKNPVPGCV
jgi:asparagine synthase (glutamine-hydrolysing)